MAKRFGSMLLFGAAAAALGGIAAYRHRKEIEQVVQDIADQLEAQEEDGFFSVDLDSEPVVHTVQDPQETEEPISEPDESDFVDLTPESEEPEA